MNFYLADTFHPSLIKLAADEQKLAKQTVYDLQNNPAHPGLQFHRLKKAKDPDLRSVRAGQDCRIILHKTNDSIVICFVDHHNPAYAWGERRKLITHPKTGAMQVVVVKEEEEIVKIPVFVEEEVQKPRPLQNIPDDDLLGYGVPPDNIAELKAANEDQLLEIAGDLPAEAAEAVLVLAVGGKPESHDIEEVGDPFQHPDARGRFRVVGNLEELKQALEGDWERWMVFLHPAQQDMVERKFNGPARVSGTAGTGKTVVALHRAVHLARENVSTRVLLTTFSDRLAALLRSKIRLLVNTESYLSERIEVIALDRLRERLYPKLVGPSEVAPDLVVGQLLVDAASAYGEERFTKEFIADEWHQVVDAWQVNSWEIYRTIPRLGRKTRLPESRREDLWRIFQHAKDRLKVSGHTTQSAMYHDLADVLTASSKTPYNFTVVDEAQDISVAQLRFLAAMGGDRPDGLYFAGDLGQRIFQQPFSWLALGVDIRGRSRTLKVNYRTSHQIRFKADRLLDPEIHDADDNAEVRTGTVSVFNGPEPLIERAKSQIEEIASISQWLQQCVAEGVEKHEIAVFVRSATELERAKVAASNVGLGYTVLDEGLEPIQGKVSLGTMHAAKGLEFRAVSVMACDWDVIPSSARIEEIGDEADLEPVTNTERHLLYVACTRARDYLMVSGVEPASEFLDDLEMG